MKCVIVLSCLLVAAFGALLPEHHITAQDMCSALPDLTFLGAKATPERIEKLRPHIVTVCEIYNRMHGSLGPIVTRGLLDGLSGLMGENSKLGTLLKAAAALNKAKGVFDEVKKLAPAVHDHLQGSIKDVHDGLQELIDSISSEFSDKSVSSTPKY